MSEEADVLTEVPRSRVPVIVILIVSTIIALAAGGLIWSDNARGFRDAGAFAELLAAVFGMISVIWLAGAVFLQREELALQRHELSLQRLEVKRLADATEEQRKTIAAQSELDRKNVTTTNVRNILISLHNNIDRFVYEIIWEFTKSRLTESNEASTYITSTMKPEGIHVLYRDNEGDEAQIGPLPYKDLNELLSTKEALFAFKALVNIARACEDAEILDWFKNDLVFYMEPIPEAGRPEIYCLLNAAAHFPPRQ